MSEKVEALAELSVARGCGFGAIGVFTFMIGLSDQMSIALKSGGILILGMSLILLARGLSAMSTPYKRTEVWIMLDPADRPNDSIAQHLIGTALRATYFRYAFHASCLSAGLLLVALILSVIGHGSA